MKSYMLISSAVFFSVLIASCKKENEPVCNAGQTGKIELVVFPQHHGAPIHGATAYVEFNTQSSPGSISNFDLTVVGEPGEEHIHLENMSCGDYFIYCVGWDSTISQTVKGGIPVSVSASASGEINVHVPVTE